MCEKISRVYTLRHHLSRGRAAVIHLPTGCGPAVCGTSSWRWFGGAVRFSGSLNCMKSLGKVKRLLTDVTHGDTLDAHLAFDDALCLR